jgi:type II secretory pathway pseudopilin PulG
MLYRNYQHSGDTIVEVLISIAMLASIITATYTMASHSLAESITASEHTAAMNLAKSQAESLKYRRLYTSPQLWVSQFAPVGINFCLNTTAQSPSGSNWQPITQNTLGRPDLLRISSDNTKYQLSCVYPSSIAAAKYYINISTKTSLPANPNPTYLITVRWERVNGRQQNLSELYYRP